MKQNLLQQTKQPLHPQAEPAGQTSPQPKPRLFGKIMTLLLAVFLMVAWGSEVQGQLTVFNRFDSDTNLWTNDTNLPWFYSEGFGSRNIPDRPGFFANDGDREGHNIVFDHTSQLTQNVNARFYHVRQLLLESDGNLTFNTNDGGGIDLGRSSALGTVKIENLSPSANNRVHTFNIPIALFRLSEINPVNGNLVFNNTISNNGNFVDVFGNNGRTLFLNGVLQGSGGIALKQNSIIRLNAAMTYTGGTAIERGELWIHDNGGISASSNITLGDASQMNQTAKIFLTKSDGGQNFSRNITVNNGNIDSRFIGSLNTSGTNTWSGNITRNNATPLVIEVVESGGTFELEGTIQGSNLTGSVTKIGPGTAVFRTQSYTGPTTVTAGTLRVLGNLASSAITVQNTATLAFGTESAGAGLMSETVITADAITVKDSATLVVEEGTTLTANSIIVEDGGILVISGTLEMAPGGTLINNGTITGSVTLQANVGNVFDPSDPDNLTETELNAALAQQGWRLLSVPVTGGTFNDLIGGLWTQGPNGGEGYDVIDPSNPNVLQLNSSGNAYVAVPDLTAAPAPGTGFAVFVFARDVYDNDTSITWPKALSVTGELHGNVQPAINSGQDVYTLLGNPFGSAITFSGLTNLNNIGGTVYVYDYAFSGPFEDDNIEGNTNPGGGFRAWNGNAGALTGGRIAPFQGFFVFATGDSPSLTIPASAAVTEGATLYREPDFTPVIQLAARINGAQVGETWFSFQDSGSFERNNYDAPFLFPLDFKPFLAMYSSFDSVGFNIKNLPSELTEKVSVPLFIEGWQPSGSQFLPMTGNVEVIWPAFENIPQDWTITLTDTHTGAVINLRDESRYEFSVVSNKSAQYLPHVKGIHRASLKSDVESRFILIIDPEMPTSAPIGSELPRVVSLSQNYPNPFNPSTLIRFELPASEEVRLEVYNVQGQRVAVLVNGTVQAGVHNVSFDASTLSSGVYLYRLQAGNQVLTRKMTLIK